MNVIGLLLLNSMLSLLLLLTHQKQEIRPRATGKIVFASPGDDLSDKASNLQPGDTLVLHDGLYANTHFLISGVHGSSTSPITIQAEHDGKAILDGGEDSSNQAVLEIEASSYITVEGLVVRNGGQDVVGVYNGDTHHILIRRVTAYNAGAGNYHVFDVAYDGVNHVVLEDDAGWGQGRYIFIAYHADDVTFRRTWARWTKQSDFSPSPRSCYSVYGSSNTTFENTICTHTIPDQPSDDYFTAAWQTTDGPDNTNTSYFGVMFFGNWEGLWINDSAGPHTQISNSYFENNRQQGTYSTSKPHGDGINWTSPQDGSITNSTFVNNEVGFSGQNGSTTISNSVFVNNDIAITGDQKHTHVAFWQNDSATLVSTDTQVNPGYEVQKYGQGAYLFVPPHSPLKGSGQGGTDIGANILYRYQDGVLTHRPLWPWPMEDRIMAETGSSVTWTRAGGIWKTLDGVYSEGMWPFSSVLWLGGIALVAVLVAGVLGYRFLRRRQQFLL